MLWGGTLCDGRGESFGDASGEGNGKDAAGSGKDAAGSGKDGAGDTASAGNVQTAVGERAVVADHHQRGPCTATVATTSLGSSAGATPMNHS